MKRVKTNGKKKETTLDDLSRMIAKGFAETATKEELAGVEERLGGQITKIDERLGIVETKLDRALYTEYVHLEARVRRVEQKVGIRK